MKTINEIYEDIVAGYVAQYGWANIEYSSPNKDAVVVTTPEGTTHIWVGTDDPTAGPAVCIDERNHDGDSVAFETREP